MFLPDIHYRRSLPWSHAFTAELSESEKKYPGFQIQIEGTFVESHPFTAEWEDGLAVYFPVPKPLQFKTCSDTSRTPAI